MKLTVAGSSSKGNCYILQNKSTALVIEAGVVLSEVRKALDWDMSKVAGVLISHEHGDHAKYMMEFCRSGIDVFCSQGTAGEKEHHRLHHVQAGTMFSLDDDWRVIPFDVVHDAREPFGYLINHPETGNILFLTDSYFSEYTFRDLNNIMVEANYDEEILEVNVASGKLHPSIRHRIITSHMGIGTCLDLLAANDLSKVNKIILLHLSDGNSNEMQFMDKVKMQTGRDVVVADAGMEVELNKTPF